MSGLVEPEQLDFEDQRGLWRDDWRVSVLTVGVLVRERQLGDLPKTHLGHTFVPTTDDLTSTQLRYKTTPVNLPRRHRLGRNASIP